MATSKKKSPRKKSKPANDKPSEEDSNETPLDLTAEDPPTTTPSEEDAPATPRATVPEVPTSKAKPAPAKPAVAKVRPGLEAGRTPKKGEFVLRVKGTQVGDPHANRNFAIRAGQKLVQAKLCIQADISIVEG